MAKAGEDRSVEINSFLLVKGPPSPLMNRNRFEVGPSGRERSMRIGLFNSMRFAEGFPQNIIS